MKKIINYKRWLALSVLVVAVGASSCKKADFLNAKSSSSLVVPTTLADFQAILDEPTAFSYYINQMPSLGDASADNYYMQYSLYQTFDTQSQSVYTWAPDIYQGATQQADWDFPYLHVLRANIVLEGLNKLSPTASTQQTWNNIKGEALFFRANSFFEVAKVYAPMYDSATAATALGIPLRLTADVSAATVRSTVKQTYDQILADLAQARTLLDAAVPVNNKNRPSQPAVFALLARVYLSMRNYTKAGLYADSCLQMYNTLIDYNTVPTSTSYYLPWSYQDNNEVMFNASEVESSDAGQLLVYLSGQITDEISVDTVLYRSYSSNDLRKTIFYSVYPNGAVSTNGSYYGTYTCFSGLAIDEVYLIRAECYARAGNTLNAMQDLNTLLIKRWENNGSWVPYTATSAADALNQILTERRKELPFRSVRWSDLRRLNKEGYNITLTRILNGQTYTLPPNDPKYVLPIPPDVIQYSGIQQNPR